MADSPPALSGFYRVALTSTFAAVAVVLVMNLATPFEFSRARLNEIFQPDWARQVVFRFSLLTLGSILASIPFCLVMRSVLAPVRRFLDTSRAGPELSHLAARRLINLPFIMVQVNLGLWVVIPAAIYTLFHRGAGMDSGTAITFGIRSVMVGMMSSAILFFRLEAHARTTFFPLFFPKGRLTEIRQAQRISIIRRIRAFYRMGTLIPLAHIVLTLVALFIQVDDSPLTTREFAGSVLTFSLVVFVLFFLGSGLLIRLISRSIADPVNHMLLAVNAVKKGNYNIRAQVVSNDEIGILGDAFNEAIQGLEDRKKIRDAFGRYVDPRVRDEILSGSVPLDGEYKEVTVLFADLKDFTSITGSRDPKAVVKMLNGYFKTMEKAIRRHKGLILQFLGDEIYAVFGAPVTDRDHPGHAVSAAFDMENRLKALNREFKAQGLPALDHGIGIHTGRVLAANIGSPDRLSYLLVGETVNLAARLQAMTRDLGTRIIVSKETVLGLTREIDPGSLVPLADPVRAKGIDRPIEIYVKPGVKKPKFCAGQNGTPGPLPHKTIP